MSSIGIIAALAAQAASPPGTATEPASSSLPASATDAPSGSYTYVDLEGGAGYSTNTNLAFGDNTASGFGRLSVHGVHTRISGRTSTVLSAFAQSTFYAQHYGTQPSLSLNASHNAQVNEKLSLFGDANVTYDEGGQLDTRIIAVPTVPLLPGVIEPPSPVISPTGDFLSVRGKHFAAGGNIGAHAALSALDSVTATTGIEYVHFKTGTFDSHYTVIPVSLGYNRQISSRTTIGVRGTAEFTNYSGSAHTRILTPQLTIQTLLSERLTFNAAIGASFASIDNGASTTHSTGFAGNATLCHVGEHDRLCAYASVAQEAATVAGPSSKTTDAGVDYSRQLDANQTIAFSLSASRYSTPFNTLLASTSHPTYLRAAADYTHKFGHRWFGGVSLGARHVAQTGPDPKTDFSGSLYIRYRLGDIR